MFEVQVRRTGGWNLIDRAPTEQLARQAAAGFRKGRNARTEVRVMGDVNGVRTVLAHWSKR